MMRTAETYIFEEMGVEMPRGEIPRRLVHRTRVANDCIMYQLWGNDGSTFCHDK